MNSTKELHILQRQLEEATREIERIAFLIRVILETSSKTKEASPGRWTYSRPFDGSIRDEM